ICAVARSGDVIGTVSRLASVKVAARGCPFTCTTVPPAPPAKFEPESIRLSGGSPTVALLCEMLDRTGAETDGIGFVAVPIATPPSTFIRKFVRHWKRLSLLLIEVSREVAGFRPEAEE